MKVSSATDEERAAPIKAYRRVYDELSAEIERGVYPAGSRLPVERELAERFGVSRPTVREALVALEINGVVSVRHGFGAYVNESPRDIAVGIDVGAFELAEARRLIESETAALAAALISDQELEQLRKCLVRMDTDDPDAAQIADRDFHFVIAAATGNTPLIHMVNALWDMRDRSPVVRRIYIDARKQSNPARVAEHQRILDALQARDPMGARDAMRGHLDSVLEHLFEFTEQEAVQEAIKQSRDRRQQFARRAV